jgi:CRISPR/Cas system-associated protein Cas7 (RAMP superfamily)
MKNLQLNFNAWRIPVLKSNSLKGWKRRIMKDLLKERNINHQNLWTAFNENFMNFLEDKY